MTLNSFSFSILNFLALGAPPQSGGGDADPVRGMISMLGPMILLFVIFYFILIRPQQKQQKELKKKLDALKVGDKVLTTSGIYGMISQVKEKSILVKIAENTKVEMLRSGVQQVLSEGDSKEDKKSV